MQELIRLNKTDLNAIEHEVNILAGETPSLDTLKTEGYRESALLNGALDMIASSGRVLTLLIAELIQAGAALIIGVVFALLEYWRVYHGAQALGQNETQSGLIAFAVVTANVVTPIYALRQLRGATHFEVTKQTGFGMLRAFLKRLTGEPVTEQKDMYYNPTLHMAAAVITWSTVILAVYDILSPLLTQIFTGEYTRPLPLMGMELLMGLGLSFAGVFFLQSAAHEVGVRILTDQPERLVDLLETRKTQREERVALIREEVRSRYMASKIAETQRKGQERAGSTLPFGSYPPEPGGLGSTEIGLNKLEHIASVNGKSVTK